MNVQDGYYFWLHKVLLSNTILIHVGQQVGVGDFEIFLQYKHIFVTFFSENTYNHRGTFEFFYDQGGLPQGGSTAPVGQPSRRLKCTQYTICYELSVVSICNLQLLFISSSHSNNASMA
jgi:hypothetical protein